tara:strand:+ start:128 stop:532 length:405 start_codon:yes stop_codon:yes gene_type:complete
MIEIPIQACSVNKYYRSCYGRVLISKEGRDFQKELELLLPSYEKVYGKIKLTIILYFRDNRKRDLDNYNKVLIDCLKNKLFEDDDQIYQLYMEKYIGCGYDKICVHVDKLEEDIPSIEKKPKRKKKKTILDSFN